MTGYGLGFPRGSKWKPIMDKTLHKLSFNGVMERLQKFWLKGACKKDQEMDSSHPLEVKNFTSAFILLGVGMGIGIALLFMEHCFFRFLRPQLRRWDRTGLCGLISMNMGRSLSFHSAVVETMEHMRHFRSCRNPMCDTQLWKAKHELDIALLKCERLENELQSRKIGTLEIKPVDPSYMPDHEGHLATSHAAGSENHGRGYIMHMQKGALENNIDKHPLEPFGKTDQGFESVQDVNRPIATRAHHQQPHEQTGNAPGGAPILPNKSQRLIQKGMSPEPQVPVPGFSTVSPPLPIRHKAHHSHSSKSPSPKHWDEFCSSPIRLSGSADGPRHRPSRSDPRGSGDPRGCGDPRGSGDPRGCGDPRGGGDPRGCGDPRGGGISGPDSPFSTLRLGSQASEDLPWGSSPPSQSSEAVETSKANGFGASRILSDRHSHVHDGNGRKSGLEPNRNDSSNISEMDPGGMASMASGMARKRSKKRRRQGNGSRGIRMEQDKEFYEETTATPAGTDSDSAARESERDESAEEEEEEEEFEEDVDDDDELLANKVVDKFLAGPIARATSQSIQDLLSSGQIPKLSRRQRYISRSRVDLSTASPMQKPLKSTGSEPNLHKQLHMQSANWYNKQESFESPSHFKHDTSWNRGQWARPNNPSVKYLPTRNPDSSVSSKDSYAADMSRSGMQPSSDYQTTFPNPELSPGLVLGHDSESTVGKFPPPLQSSASFTHLLKQKSRGTGAPLNPNPLLPRSSGSGGATRGGDPPFTLLDMEWRRGPNGRGANQDDNYHNSDWEKKKKVEIEREKKRNPMPKRKKRRNSQSPSRTHSGPQPLTQGPCAVISGRSIDAGSETDDIDRTQPQNGTQQQTPRAKKTYKNGHCYYELSTRGF